MRDYVDYLDPENTMYDYKEACPDELACWLTETEEGWELFNEYVSWNPDKIEPLMNLFRKNQVGWFRSDRKHLEYGKEFAKVTDEIVLKLVEDEYDEINRHYSAYMLQNMLKVR